MGPKYEFTSETKNYDGHILHRIRRLSDDQLGGWIESEDNLSQDDNCWVNDNAKVYGNAEVCDNAPVFGHADITGNVTGNQQVDGKKTKIQN